MRQLIETLYDGDFSCVISNENEIRTYSNKGVNNIFQLYKKEPKFLRGAIIADRVVGKSTAALFVKCRISKLYADEISTSALFLLYNANITVEYLRVVPYIGNSDNTGKCQIGRAHV